MSSNICKYCKQSFDGKSGTIEIPPDHMAHKDCFTEMAPYTDKVMAYMFTKLGTNLNVSKVQSQLAESPYTVKEVFATLKYFYDVKEGSPASANGGIGIVPYVHDEAIAYWKQKNEKKKKIAAIDNIEQYYTDKAEYSKLYDYTIPFKGKRHNIDDDLP